MRVSDARAHGAFDPQRQRALLCGVPQDKLARYSADHTVQRQVEKKNNMERGKWVIKRVCVCVCAWRTGHFLVEKKKGGLRAAHLVGPHAIKGDANSSSKRHGNSHKGLVANQLKPSDSTKGKDHRQKQETKP